MRTKDLCQFCTTALKCLDAGRCALSSSEKEQSMNALIVELDELAEGGNGWNPAYHPKAANEQEREFRDRLAIEWPRIRAALLGPLPTPVSARPAISTIPLFKRLREQRDQLADALRHILWIKDCGVDGSDEHGTFRNWPETERDGMYNIAKDALKDVPNYVQQLRNVAAGLGMEYDELVRCLDGGNAGKG